MKISIIGGGPAGLYFASTVKSLNPDYQVSIYEAKNESENSFGLGYTLQSLSITLLEKMDENYFQALFPNQQPLIISKALLKTNTHSQILDFSDGYSVKRSELMLYLQNKAVALGVNIEEKKISYSHLKRLKQSSDLLVGADGVNSVVRHCFSSQFIPKTYPAKLKFSWFINETSQIRKEACFYAFQTSGGVVLMTSYPLTEHKQVVIIEMTDACLNSTAFKGKSPAEAAPYLNEILSSNGDDISLISSNLPWYTFKMNTLKNLSYENVTLLGDAARSFHYSAGQGLTSAFMMGYTLANCLHKNSNIPAALQHYEQSSQLMFENPTTQSFAHIKWFENMDEHFKNTPREDWIELFQKKDKFDVIT